MYIFKRDIYLFLLAGKCDVCGQVRDMEELNSLILRANQFIEQARQKKGAGDLAAATDLYRKAISVFRNQILHPFNAELMTYVDEAMSTCIGK